MTPTKFNQPSQTTYRLFNTSLPRIQPLLTNVGREQLIGSDQTDLLCTVLNCDKK